MEHYQAAVALRPDSPWARNNRALLYRERGDLDSALDDLNRALASPQGADFPEARLNLGIVKEALGDDAGARAAYESVIAAGPRPGAVFVAIDYMTGLGTDIVRRDEVRLDGHAGREPQQDAKRNKDSFHGVL